MSPHIPFPMFAGKWIIGRKGQRRSQGWEKIFLLWQGVLPSPQSCLSAQVCSQDWGPAGPLRCSGGRGFCRLRPKNNQMVSRQFGKRKPVVGCVHVLKNLCFFSWILTQATGLHARGDVHRVTKQTVARHNQTNHTCYTGTYSTPTLLRICGYLNL